MNTTFSWAKGIGYGVFIWLILFAFVSALVGFEVQETIWAQTIIVAVAGVLSYFFAYSADPQSPAYALGYGVLWAAVGVLLDLVISYQFNAAIFSSWQYWVTYALVLIAPLAQAELQPSGKHSTA